MNQLFLWQKLFLKKDYIYKLQNTCAISIPKLNKIVVNTCMNDAINDSKQILVSITALELITNQKPNIYRSKKSIAEFKLKKYTIIGCNLILRGNKIYDFIGSFIFFVLPKLINFKNFFTSTNSKAYNNINMGIIDLIPFPPLNNNSICFQKKIGATFTFIAKSNFQNIDLLLNSYQVPCNIKSTFKHEKKISIR
jgi:large subunit ribosomal protein L5